MDEQPTPVPPEDSPGGSGGIPEATARDTRLLERAIKSRWPIPQEDRGRIVALLIKVAANPRASHRNRIVAARALFQADAQNLEQEKREGGLPDQTHEHRHSGTVEHEHRIGIDPGAFADFLADVEDAASRGVRRNGAK
jgi:hypothetical protein